MCPKAKYVEKSMPKVPGWSISGRFLKCGSVHTLMAKIAHNPLHFGEGFSPELKTRIKRVRKTTNVADARDRPLGREVYKKGFELLIINI